MRQLKRSGAWSKLVKEGSKVILFPGLGFAGVDERANETYLRKVISCLCSDTFVDGGLGTREILAKAYARLYLIGAKLEIPCLKSKCLQKLSGLYEHPVVFLDMAQIVYGNSLLGEDFQVYFRSKSEFSVTSSDQNAQALVKRLGSQGGHLATDILSVQTASFQRLRRQSDEYRRQSIDLADRLTQERIEHATCNALQNSPHGDRSLTFTPPRESSGRTCPRCGHPGGCCCRD